MEKSIGSIVSKIDTVLVKLDHMERNKSKRKAAMSKILGTITEDDGSKSRNLSTKNMMTLPIFVIVRGTVKDDKRKNGYENNVKIFYLNMINIII